MCSENKQPNLKNGFQHYPVDDPMPMNILTALIGFTKLEKKYINLGGSYFGEICEELEWENGGQI